MTVYERVVSVAKPYLGPATESFISRQCKSHLKKEAPDLTAGELATLAKWMEVGGGLVMDQAKASEMAKKVMAL